MKFKMAVPNNLLTGHQISLVEGDLGKGLVGIVQKNFPNWQQKKPGEITGGEVILQLTDMTVPIEGLAPGIHLTISLVSYMDGRDLDGLARDAMALIKQTKDEQGTAFMSSIAVFTQMTLDSPVVKSGTQGVYSASGDGRSLLEYLG